MANSFFSNEPSMVPYYEGTPVRLTIAGYEDNDKLFITKMAGSIAPNYQLMYSIGATAFLNAFSQRMSFWNLNGFHLYKDCSGNDTATGAIAGALGGNAALGTVASVLNTFTGVAGSALSSANQALADTNAGQTLPEFVAFYNKNNIVRADKPLLLSFVGITLQGFFVNLQLDEFKKSAGADQMEGMFYTLMFLGKAMNILDDFQPLAIAPASTTGSSTNPVRSGQVQPPAGYNPPVA
jgi:hypothetical protein